MNSYLPNVYRRLGDSGVKVTSGFKSQSEKYFKDVFDNLGKYQFFTTDNGQDMRAGRGMAVLVERQGDKPVATFYWPGLITEVKEN